MTDNIPTTDERWLPIPGYEGWYEVSDYGRVKSLKRRHRCGTTSYKTRILRGSINYYGYKVVALGTSLKQQKFFSAHKIVMLAFIGPRPTKHDINHIDYNKSNNRLDNLEYVTRKQNCFHSLERMTIAKPRGENHPKTKVNYNQIIEIREMSRNKIRIRMIAKRFGMSISGIKGIIARRTWKHIYSPDSKIK